MWHHFYRILFAHLLASYALAAAASLFFLASMLLDRPTLTEFAQTLNYVMMGFFVAPLLVTVALLLFLVEVLQTPWDFEWPPFIVWSVYLLFFAFIHHRLARADRPRPPRNLCPHCNYDLRATPNPHGPLLPTCPECGHPTRPPHAPPLP